MSLKNFKDFVGRYNQFILTAHLDPDADAAGAEYALLKTLHALGKRAVIFNSNNPEEKYLFFDKENSFHALESEGFPPDLEPFALIICDTSDLAHIGLAHDLLYKKALETFIIDHHTIGILPDCHCLVDESAAATCQIVYDLMEYLKVPQQVDTAQALYTGIVYDSGGFIYPKTSPHTFEVAKKLVEAGVRPKEIHSNLYEQIPATKMRLLAKVQSTMEILFNDSVAIQTMSMSMLRDSGASYADADAFVNYPLKCNSIKVSAFFKETEQGKTKCSLRSKGDIDVAKIVLPYGGGGHRNAAGFLWNGSLEQIRRLVLESVETAILQDLDPH